MAAVDDGLGAMIRLAGELGQPTLHWMATCFEVSPLLLAGRIAEAETVARQAFELGQVAGAPDAFRCYGTQLFWIRFDQGRLTEVMETVERAAGRPGASRLTRAALAWALCELDRLDEARPLVLELAAGAFADAPFHYMSLLGLTMVAGACAALGDVAGTLYDQLKPHHAVIPTSGLVTFGSVEYYLGLLAATLTRLDDAAGHFAAAAAVHERIGAPTWLARTRLEWGRMLLSHREAGNAERARELLGQASATARELGLVNVERRAVELLASQ